MEQNHFVFKPALPSEVTAHLGIFLKKVYSLFLNVHQESFPF